MLPGIAGLMPQNAPEFLAALRQLAAACEFGDSEEQMLCDQLIINCQYVHTGQTLTGIGPDSKATSLVDRDRTA